MIIGVIIDVVLRIAPFVALLIVILVSTIVIIVVLIRVVTLKLGGGVKPKFFLFMPASLKRNFINTSNKQTHDGSAFE